MNYDFSTERASLPKRSDMRREAERAHSTDEVPPDIHLPPMAAEACRCGVRMMISVPVFSPRSDLQRTEPPDVLARIHAFGKAGLQGEQAIDESLHVERVDQANRTKPENPCPSKKEVSECEGKNDQVW